MDEIYSNKYLNYGYITALTLLFIILIVNIIDGSFTKFSGSIMLSINNIKLILLLLVITTYLTLIMPSLRMLAQKKIKGKALPRGKKGSRGNRGKKGAVGACNECGDELCYKKIMFNITKTINLWRQKNNLKLLEDNYIIENEFIKDKVKKHCGSMEFKNILSKYGSNNDSNSEKKTIPKDIKDKCLGNKCKYGAYDFLFKLWSIWILIILKFKNGMYFLESEGLNENDFKGLLIDIDVKLKKDTIFKVMFNDLPADTESATTETERRYKKNFVNMDVVKKNNKSYEWKYISSNDDVISSGDDVINEDFFTNNLVQGSSDAVDFIVSPFEIIKQFQQWTWGSDPATKTKVILTPGVKDELCNKCPNAKYCNKENISNTDPVYDIGAIDKLDKFNNSLFPDHFKLLINTSIYKNANLDDEAEEDDDTYNIKTPFKNLKELPNLKFYRVRPFIDEKQHPYFRVYKPLGDILIDSSISKDIKNINDINPIMVSGDIKPPVDFELIDINIESTVDFIPNVDLLLKGDGINGQTEKLNIWKPKPPDGYKACGFVIDTSFSKRKPPRDIIATIPIHSSLTESLCDNTNIRSIDINNSSYKLNYNYENGLFDIISISPEQDQKSFIKLYCDTVDCDTKDCIETCNISSPRKSNITIKSRNIETKKDDKYKITKLFE